MSSPSPLQRLATFKDPNPLPPEDSSLPPDTDPLSSLEKDPIFSAFLSPTFSPSLFSSSALSSNSSASTVESLHHHIRLLSLHLRRLVLLHHPLLLHHLHSLHHSSQSLPLLRSHLQSLLQSLRKSRLDLADPRKLLHHHSLQLQNLHRSLHLLSSSSRFLRLIDRLRKIVSSPNFSDLARAADLHRELDQLYVENDLKGISLIDNEIKWLNETGARLRDQAMKAVEKGMDESNQNDIWCGLQVFYNLGELRTAVDLLVGKYRGVGMKSVGVAMDMKAISGGGVGGGPGGVQRSGTPQIGGGKRAAEGLWERMGKCMDEVHKVVVAVWHLQTVLLKKRVPFSQVVFLHEVWQEGEPLLTDRVWEALVKTFANQIKSSYNASSFVKEVFTHGYPKLYSIVENLLERISRDTDVKGVLPALSPEGKEQLVAAINTFEMAYITQCLGRLTENVNSLFQGSNRTTIPSKDQISRIIIRIQEEIEVVRMHGHLLLLILREISKILFLIAQKAEYQISTGVESRQVTGPATPAQIKNFALCQHLQEIHSRISSTASSLPPVAADILSASLGAIYGVACDAVTSLFQAMLDRLESCILKMHEQDFGADGIDATMDNTASGYMDELQKFTVHFRNEFLSKLLPSSASRSETICTGLVRRMASRVLIFFIRHAALVRPLSESGKLRMARDMAELELAVGQNLVPVEQLGAPYRALRALRPVIFLETSQLAGSPLIKDLPPSVILHHLYSRAPDELQSPLQRNMLTHLQYSLWLDSQGEDQIWKGIKVTLNDYEAKVRSRGEQELSPVYPLMLEIGSSMVEKSTIRSI